MDRDPAERFANFVHTTRLNNLPPEVVAATRIYILDTIGVALAGSMAPGCQELKAVVNSGSLGTGSSHIVLHGIGAPAPVAAMVNSVYAHALDFDDTYDNGPLHTNSCVLPAALAVVGLRPDLTGGELLAAVAVGNEINCRLAGACQAPIHFARSPITSIFGATAAAAKLLGATEPQIANAFGIALSCAAGNLQCVIDGALVKRMQPGFMAQAGVNAALLAIGGITGATGVFCGRHGFYNTYERDQFDPAFLTEGLGTRYESLLLSLKPYPSCRFTHPVIDAALQIRTQLADLVTWQSSPFESVEQAIVALPRQSFDVIGSPFMLRQNPQVDAQFSAQFTFAVALERGQMGVREITNVRDLANTLPLSKVRIIQDDKVGGKDIVPVSARVTLAHGAPVTCTVDAIPGSPERPLSKEEVEAKYWQCVSASPLGKETERARAVLAAVNGLGNAPIRELSALLSAA